MVCYQFNLLVFYFNILFTQTTLEPQHVYIMEKSCKVNAKRLLKCFCGCSDLTEDEVKRIYRFSTQETLINQQAAKLLRKYLEMIRQGDKSDAEQMLDIYEKCEEYMTDYSLLTKDELEELSDLGLPYNLKKELLANILTADESNIKGCLSRIQGECRNELEASKEFSDYRDAILKKLRQVDRR